MPCPDQSEQEEEEKRDPGSVWSSTGFPVSTFSSRKEKEKTTAGSPGTTV